MKTKQVNIKTRKVMIMYGGKNLSLHAIEKQRAWSRRDAINHQVCAKVPSKIKDLLVEQARIEGLNMTP